MRYTNPRLLYFTLLLGAAQQPPKSTYPSVSANAIAAHLIQVAKAPHDKKFERQVRMQGRTLLQKSHLSGAYIAHWTSWSRDWTGLGTLVSLFLVFFLLHFCSFRELKLSLLPDGFSLHVKYTVS